MKIDYIKWALPVAALCLLATSCSKDNNPEEPTAPKTRTLTIDCGIGATADKADTRAGVKPGNTDKTKEEFIWHASDVFNGWLIPDGGSAYDATAQEFVIDKNYSDAAPSKKASFECSYFPNTESYKMLAVYPKANSKIDFYGELEVSTPKTQTQTGRNNTRHLAAAMNMYATTTVNAGSQVPSLAFHHLSSLFRFTVTNKNATEYRIQSIKVRNTENNYFGRTSRLKVLNWENGTIENTSSSKANDATITLYSTDGEGIKLSAAGAADKLDTFDAYMMVAPGAEFVSDTELTFNISGLNADGAPKPYTSLALKVDQIMAQNGYAKTWQPGKRYWFNLVLDNELTVTVNSITVIPGWGDEEIEL